MGNLEQTRQHLRQAKEQLKQARQRYSRARQRLGRTEEQLEQSKQRSSRTRQALRRAKEQLEQSKQRSSRTRQALRRAKEELEQTGQRLWHTRRQLKQLAREYVLCRMPKHSVCAEIGVHEGDFSRLILDTVEPKRLHLIDPWKHEEGDRYQGSWYGGLGPSGQAIMEERYRGVKESLSAEVHADQVQIHRDFSTEASGGFTDGYFDWIYIDGDHTYEAVKRDLESYHPKIKVGGYITGDDYGTRGWWDNGVQKAVDEFVSQRPDTTLEVKGSQFIIEKGSPDRSGA